MATKQGADETRVVIGDCVYYAANDGPHKAPCGEYALEAKSDCVGLCACSGANSFTLSYDAYIRHLTEGRIRIVAD
jgi:hypothetical protein